MAMRKLKSYKPTKFMAKTSHYDKDAAGYAKTNPGIRECFPAAKA